MVDLAPGLGFHPAYLDRAAQEALLGGASGHPR